MQPKSIHEKNPPPQEIISKSLQDQCNELKPKKKYFLCKSYFSKNPTKNLNNETKTKLFSTKIIEVNEIEREIKEFAYLAVTKTTKK